VLLVAALVLVAPESAAIAIGAPDPGDVKPQIVWKKIPFGARASGRWRATRSATTANTHTR
jgi:hypothetical protein